MKKKWLSILLAACMVLPTSVAIACGGGSGGDPNADIKEIGEMISKKTDNVTLNLAVKFDANAMISYNQEKAAGEYVAANGTTYKDGDIKPVWEELASRLNFTINDVTYSKYSGTGNLDSHWKAILADDFAGVDMINSSADNFVEFGTTDNRFVDLSQYLDYMPNLKNFLDNNSIVKTSITDANGKMFYAPYFDGYDDIERMFMLRVDWVEKLLDGATVPAELDQLEFAAIGEYKRFMPATMDTSFTIVKADGSGTQTITKKYGANGNIIDKQNALTGANRNGKKLVEDLRAYIDSTYNNAYGNKRSELFCGVNAAYDADELVALLRAVKANPTFLSGNSNATIADIVPFYPRNSTPDRVMDMFRLSQIWGQRGFDSRRGFLYVGADGKLYDNRMEASTMDSLTKLNQLYKEGLILQSFDDATAANTKIAAIASRTPKLTTVNADSQFRGVLNVNNLGFMTYDYNQTTTVHNNLATGVKIGDETIKYEGFNLTPILPPFTDWGKKDGSNVQYTRHIESWRSVKPDGWGIFTGLSKEKTARALALIDYLYSEDGNKLMSYGPSDWIDGTIEYNGKNVPKLSAAALKELQDYAGGNYTNYYRRFLGATMPIGYVKEQGMEYQCVHDKGKVGLENILLAVSLGTITHQTVDNVNESDKTLWSVPTTLPFTRSQQAAMRDSFATLNTNFNTTSSGSQNAFVPYVINGFGVADKTLSKEKLIEQIKDTWNCKTFLSISQAAFERSVANVG